MATAAETDAMRRAITLAARALGATSPNPVVGCVVLDVAGEPAGEGWHHRAGAPHAEIEALRTAGERARGGTAVVTLEPCNHTGRTGPCAAALIEAGIARVVYAVADPTPTATGGAATLAAAGVDVEGGLLTAEAARGNETWLTAVRLGRPFVLWKYAATLDGRVAAADGTSRWITSPESRADVHRLRAEADAVLVGAGTLRADDPHLAVRGAAAEAGAVQPLRVVADPGASIRPGARLLDGTAPTLVAVADDLPAAATARLRELPGVEVLALPRDPSGPGIAVRPLLVALYERGVRAVLLEGGPTLAGSFLRAGAVDKVIGYLAPVLLGAGPAALGPAGVGTLADAPRLELAEAVRIGPDLRITGYPRRPARPNGTNPEEN